MLPPKPAVDSVSRAGPLPVGAIHAAFDDEAPDVDPVNSRFAWVRHPTNTLMSELFVENFDGTHRKQLTSLNSQILNPRFVRFNATVDF